MKLYQHPRCSTCKKALQFLESKGVELEFADLTQASLRPDELKAALASVGSLRKLFNTSGMRYRELKLKDKLDQMSEEEAIELLASDGMLVKRPLLFTGDAILVGFREEQWDKAL